MTLQLCNATLFCTMDRQALVAEGNEITTD